jgi:hypothetical protein
MSTSSRSPTGGWQAPGTGFGDSGGEGSLRLQQFGEGRGERGGADGGGPGSAMSRRKRRRQRTARPKRRRGGPGRPSIGQDLVSRESMFQDIEGLLRQIRERAEETAEWTAEQLSDFTHTVTGFTKSLEDEGQQISDRVRSEYHRIREKLSQALRG